MIPVNLRLQVFNDFAKFRGSFQVRSHLYFLDGRALPTPLCQRTYTTTNFNGVFDPACVSFNGTDIRSFGRGYLGTLLAGPIKILYRDSEDNEVL